MSSQDDWFSRYCVELERSVGRGWKRRLAEKVGVSESNVQTWLKSGRVPPAVRTAIELHDEVQRLEVLLKDRPLTHRRSIEVVTSGHAPTFRIVELDEKTGLIRRVAENIARFEDALQIRNLPVVREKLERAVDRLDPGSMYTSREDAADVRTLLSPGWDEFDGNAGAHLNSEVVA